MSRHMHVHSQPISLPCFCQTLPGPSSCWRSCRSQVTFPVTSSSLWRRSFRVSSAQPSERWVTIRERTAGPWTLTWLMSWDFLFFIWRTFLMLPLLALLFFFAAPPINHWGQCCDAFPQSFCWSCCSSLVLSMMLHYYQVQHLNTSDYERYHRRVKPFTFIRLWKNLYASQHMQFAWLWLTSDVSRSSIFSVISFWPCFCFIWSHL